MAFNGASHNAPGIPLGPATGQPPPLSDESTDAILKAASDDIIGEHKGAKDVPPPVASVEKEGTAVKSVGAATTLEGDAGTKG